MPEPLISIVTATIRPEAFCGLVDNLAETLSTPAACEVLVKVDDEDPETAQAVRAYAKTSRIRVRVFSLPRGKGYWDLWRGYNVMSAEVEGEFLIGLNDQIRFASRHWDLIVAQHRGLFSDGIYHLRTSVRRNFRFTALVEAFVVGESIAFLSRKWIETVGGWAIGPACGDTGQECVNYYLRTRFNIDRGVDVDGITLTDEENMHCPLNGLSPAAQRRKTNRIIALYTEILDQAFCQDQFVRNAARLAALIHAGGKGILQEDATTCEVSVAPMGPGFSYKLTPLEWMRELIDLKPTAVTPESFSTGFRSWPSRWWRGAWRPRSFWRGARRGGRAKPPCFCFARWRSATIPSRRKVSYGDDAGGSLHQAARPGSGSGIRREAALGGRLPRAGRGDGPPCFGRPALSGRPRASRCRRRRKHPLIDVARLGLSPL